jgi:DNA-binding transcriptional MerR regulator
LRVYAGGMDEKLTISKVAHQSGMSIPNIRFYEAQGIVPTPGRTEGGYRLYSPNDVRRLRLARRARQLGLSLAEVKSLVERAFASDCGAYAQEILDLVATQRARIDQQIAELLALRGELDSLERNARVIAADVPAGLTVDQCGRCLLVDGEGGEGGLCQCTQAQQVIPLESLRGDTMRAQRRPDALDILVCEIGKRPAGAPTIEDILGSVTEICREGDTLIITFEPAAEETVRAVVEAERACCSTIGWNLETEHGLQLVIDAKPVQLDTLEAMFEPQGAS